jgi:hypothetical protein
MILKQNIRSGSDVKTTITTTTTTKISERSKVLFLMSSLFFNGTHRLYIDDYGMYFFITVLKLLKSVFDEFTDVGTSTQGILDSEKIQTFIELVGYFEVLRVLLNCLTKQKRFGDVVFDQDNVENAFRLSILVIVGFVYGIYNEHIRWFTYQDIPNVSDWFRLNTPTTEATQDAAGGN